MSCVCCGFKSVIRPLVVAEREEGGVKFLSPEESKRLPDEAPGSSSEKEGGVKLSSRVVEVVPASPEGAEGDAVNSPPPTDREERKVHTLGMSELLDELNLTRGVISIRKSDSEAESASSIPAHLYEPAYFYEPVTRRTVGVRLPAISRRYEFPNSEEGKRQRLRAVQRGVVATVVIRLASAVFPY
ncbi:MAG: hypothetical protein OXF02_05170 [Simkaniaceae bacterium]|nr:hypothetical protein [Simkaniaceae bacterium]